MKRLTALLCLTIAVLLGSAGGGNFGLSRLRWLKNICVVLSFSLLASCVVGKSLNKIDIVIDGRSLQYTFSKIDPNKYHLEIYDPGIIILPKRDFEHSLQMKGAKSAIKNVCGNALKPVIKNYIGPLDEGYGGRMATRVIFECVDRNQVDRKYPDKPPPISNSTGSGFFVSKLGHIVTNEHVVRKCGSVTVGDNANNQVPVEILETDKRNDLALVRISSNEMASAETKSLISKLTDQKLGLKLVPLASEGLFKSDDVELGEDVLVAGYPYGELFSNSIKVTKGIVSSNKGMGDDRGRFQMDAAVQPGNSGGPIYDENGNIVGVVVAQLNKMKFVKQSGSIPENVNFGIKASTVRQFLSSSGLTTKWSKRSKKMSTSNLARIAEKQTVMVVCHQ